MPKPSEETKRILDKHLENLDLLSTWLDVTDANDLGIPSLDAFAMKAIVSSIVFSRNNLYKIRQRMNII